MIRRGLALILGLALAFAAWELSGRERLAEPPWLASWRAAHPDRRDLGAEGASLVSDQEGAARRDDALVLLVALAAGCLVVALRPESTRARLDDVSALLVFGSACAGLGWLGVSVAEQVRKARADQWTLADDNLVAVAGPLAERLVEWRDRIGPDDAVLVVGTRDFLLNLVAWSLHPRPIHPVIPPVPVPDDFEAARLAREVAALDLGRDAPARWMVDLEALSREEVPRPVLVRLDP